MMSIFAAAVLMMVRMLMMVMTITGTSVSMKEERIGEKTELRAILRRYERDPRRDSTKRVIFLKTHKVNRETFYAKNTHIFSNIHIGVF